MSDILNFILQILVVMVAFWLGKKYGRLEAFTTISVLLDKNSFKEITEDVLTEIAEDLEVERVDDCYLAYCNGDFVAQGTDFKDLINNVKKRFPRRVFKVVSFDATWTEEDSQRLVEAINRQHDRE